MNVALREPETAVQSSLLRMPVGQLPVPVQPTLATPDLYERVDAVMGSLDRAMTYATRKVGEYAPYYHQIRPMGYAAIGGLATIGAVVAGVALRKATGWDWQDASGAGLASGFFGGLLASGLWYLYCNRAESENAERAPNAEELGVVRAVVAREVSAIEQAALGESAEVWQATLIRRKVFGYETQDILSGLTARRAALPPEEVARVRRWAGLRSAIAAYTDGSYVDHRMLVNIRAAFEALPADEQLQLAPTVLAKIFEREAPIKRGWQFHEAYKLYSELYRVSIGLPAKPPAEEEAKADTEPTVESSQAVAHSNTIASLDDTAAAFEAALQRCLKQERSVLASDIAPAIAIARAPERTPVELVALGVRTRRFMQQLDEKQLYGYEARQLLAELAKASEHMAPGLREQIARIDRYRSALDLQAPTTLGSSAVSLILEAIEELYPCDRAVGAERAFARYFNEDGTPRFKADYSDQQRLLNALLDYRRKASAPAC